MEEKILQEQSTLVKLKSQIREVIAQVDKPEYQTVLRYRYIHNYTWSCIAELVKADIVNVQRWHNKAISRIVLPENAINLKVAMVCNKMQ